MSMQNLDNRMKILVTAIGSMSAECVIKRLKERNHTIVGCDIYPGEWHYETTLCDVFFRAPFATDENTYIQFLLDKCQNEHIDCILPLTDLEIDVINRHRSSFEQRSILLAMQSKEVLEVARNKYLIYHRFANDPEVPTVKTFLLSELPDDFNFPCIAKPVGGRSSEGLIRNATKSLLKTINEKESYIVQEQLNGSVFTVDYVRSAKTNTDVALPREELLRTKNGAGLTVRMVKDPNLIQLTSYIGKNLNINGCVNMEFIHNQNRYYLIDINPRFSAGVAFSDLAGYDMVTNHMNCFMDKPIDKQITIEERILIKKYIEIINA